MFINWSKYSLKVLLITLWKVGGPFLTPNGITIQTKSSPIGYKTTFVSILRGLEI
jgi:hypothetical protein